MARFLAYVDAVPGRLYPLVATLLELSRRGHHVTVKAGIDDIARLRSVGLHAEPLAPPIERFEPDDWKARTRFGALMSGLRQFGERGLVVDRPLLERDFTGEVVIRHRRRADCGRPAPDAGREAEGRGFGRVVIGDQVERRQVDRGHRTQAGNRQQVRCAVR